MALAFNRRSNALAGASTQTVHNQGNRIGTVRDPYMMITNQQLQTNVLEELARSERRSS